MTNISRGDQARSLVARHCWNCDNCKPQRHLTRFVHMERNLLKRRLLECAYIKIDNKCFAQNSLDIPNVWLQLLKDDLMEEGQPKRKQHSTCQPAEQARRHVERPRQPAGQARRQVERLRQPAEQARRHKVRLNTESVQPPRTDNDSDDYC